MYTKLTDFSLKPQPSFRKISFKTRNQSSEEQRRMKKRKALDRHTIESHEDQPPLFQLPSDLNNTNSETRCCSSHRYQIRCCTSDRREGRLWWLQNRVFVLPPCRSSSVSIFRRKHRAQTVSASSVASSIAISPLETPTSHCSRDTLDDSINPISMPPRFGRNCNS